MNDDSRVVITRRRWDWYFLPVIALMTLVALGLFAFLGEAKPLFFPGFAIALWLLTRFNTSKRGESWRTIRGTPGMPQMLAWGGFALLLFAALTAFDCLFLGGIQRTLQPYQFALYALPLVVMFIGAWHVDKRYPRSSRRMRSDSQDQESTEPGSRS
jgi:hypothetical protein